MTNPIVLEAPVKFWKCPSCETTARTQRADFHQEFHACPALGNMNIPLVEVNDPDDNPRSRQVAVQSEFGYETSSVRTERMDGSNDVTVFPQPAVGTISY